MKKYTIIYTESFMSGCHMQTLTYHKHVETDDLKTLVDEKYPGVVFIFKGWSEHVIG